MQESIIVKYISEANMHYFMNNSFACNIMFTSIEDYEQAIKLDFNLPLWELKNSASVLIAEATKISSPTAIEKEGLINWWTSYLKFNN